jgi:hypothetical protein
MMTQAWFIVRLPTRISAAEQSAWSTWMIVNAVQRPVHNESELYRREIWSDPWLMIGPYRLQPHCPYKSNLRSVGVRPR